MPQPGVRTPAETLRRFWTMLAHFHGQVWNAAELDLLLFRRGKAWGVEFKVGDGPQMTGSLHIALEDLKLERAWIIHPGSKSYPVHDQVEALPLAKLEALVDTIMG